MTSTMREEIKIITHAPKITWAYGWQTARGMLNRCETVDCRDVRNLCDTGISVQSGGGYGTTHGLMYQMFNRGMFMSGNIIAAGGSVLSAIEYASHVKYANNPISVCATNLRKASDIDLYVRGNSQQEILQTVNALINYLTPAGDVTRSEYAISFYAPYDKCINSCINVFVDMHAIEGFKPPYVKIQIIDRPLPRSADIKDDIAQLFSTYDFDMCKFAHDGDFFYTTDRATETFVTRICKVPYSKLTDSTISRMARYALRCYDFEIEGCGCDDERKFNFPEATAKINLIAKSDKTLDCDGLPSSNYAKSNANSMFKMMKAYGRNGSLPHLAFGNTEDIRYMIGECSQPVGYMTDWKMTTLGKMCETITWMSISSESDREMMQMACVRSIQEWDQICSTALKFREMFSKPPEFVGLSDEIKEKYWKPSRIINYTKCMVVD